MGLNGQVPYYLDISKELCFHDNHDPQDAEVLATYRSELTTALLARVDELEEILRLETSA